MIPCSASFALYVVPDRDRVEDRVDRHAGEDLLLGERDAELLVGLEQLRVDLVEAAERLLGLGRGVVDDGLVVDRRDT